MGISVRNATKVIKGATVLDNVSLDIPHGRVTGLRGINGSGKTMLMRAVCGLIRLSGGTVEVDGKVLGRDIDSPSSVGLLIENPAFWMRSAALATCGFWLSFRGGRRAKMLLRP